MVGLLDIPLELREPILVDVILDTTQQMPEEPISSDSGTDTPYRIPSRFDGDKLGPVLVRSLQRHSMPLLHVNQQIRDEVIDLMPRRLGQQIDDATVDFTFMNEVYATYPRATWLSAPFPTNHRNTVHVKIRYFQIPPRSLNQQGSILYLPTTIGHRSGQACQCWVQSQNTGFLLGFLTETLMAQSGSASIYEAQRKSGGEGNRIPYRTIQNLVIDIPFELNQQDSLDTRVRCPQFAGVNGATTNNSVHRMIPSGKRQALLLAQSLEKELLSIFNAEPRLWCRDSVPTIILERIGRIEVKVQGKLFGSLDLSQMLAKLPRTEEWSNNAFGRADFFGWKRAAEEKRKLAGFKVASPSVQEYELAGSAGWIARILAARAESLVPKASTLSVDGTPSTRQPVGDERVAFTGNAVFVQEDGSELFGNATFYSSTASPWQIMLIHVGLISTAFVINTPPEIPISELEFVEQPKDGELVLFKGEAILFQSEDIHPTITSGDAIFYGRAGEPGMEHPGSIKVVSP